MLVSVASVAVEEGTQKRTKSLTHFRAGLIDFDLKITSSTSAGQPWMLPAVERPSIMQ